MSKFRNDVLNALIEEMDKADGKGVADKSVDKMPKASGDSKEEKIKLKGGGDEVGGTLPAKPPAGKVPGGEPEMKSPEGKGVAKEGGSTEEAGGGKAEGMDQEGSSVAKGEVKQTKDLPKNPNVAEGYTLPHEIMVEQDGKQIKLAAGTRFHLVSEAKKCEDKDCKDMKCPTHGKKGMAESVVTEDENPFGGEKKEDDKPAEEKAEDDKPAEKAEGESESPVPPKAEGEGESEEAAAPAVESDIPMDEDTPLADAGSDGSIIDRLAMSIDDLAGSMANMAADFKEFLGVEAEEPEHMDDMAGGEMGGADMDAAVDSIGAEGAGLDLEAPEDNVVTDGDLPNMDAPGGKVPFK